MYKINRDESYCPITWTTLSPATTLPLLAADSFISSVPSSVPTFWRTAFWCSLAPTKWYSFSSLPTMHYRHNKYGFSTRFLRHLHVACAFSFLLLYPPRYFCQVCTKFASFFRRLLPPHCVFWIARKNLQKYHCNDIAEKMTTDKAMTP